MTTALLLGAMFGAGLALLAAWIRPAPLSLAAAFALMHPTIANGTTRAGPLPAHQPGIVSALGRPLAPLLTRLGLPRHRTRANLTVCGKDPIRHVAEQAATALAGFLLPPAFAALIGLGGVSLGWQVPLWASLLLAGLGLWLPDLALASQAAQRRTALRDGVSAMLDLVVVSLAGGAGIEQALRDATEDAEDWAAQALRHAIEAAHLRRQPPWQALGELGQATGVTTLSELSAALSMAGTEGARIRATLTARSAALQTHLVAEAEAAAMSATERMVLPLVALLGGFLIFLLYPAFASILGAL
ncbi:type II secretion system F family protein [Catellatospora chokoriensis]|uniref:Type II secretion system protein n=1 Tax=Catellatospora chokoriensis TaxID=310353 RepID=A0A8J3NRR4_9ACTN|nr:type II secretion system F family protein [Catellatospora chokoriensis]GIF89786.1 type II secretion system protein [Catellatospora chokoriensis]